MIKKEMWSKIDYPYLYQLKLYSIASYYLNNGVQEQVKVMINHTSGQIMKFHQPRFPWNKRDFPYIWPNTCEFLLLFSFTHQIFCPKIHLEVLRPPNESSRGKGCTHTCADKQHGDVPLPVWRRFVAGSGILKKNERLLQVNPQKPKTSYKYSIGWNKLK